MASLRWRHWGRLLRGRAGNELAIAHRVVVNGQPEHPVEEKPATRRSPAIEPEGELVEVGRQVLGVHAALVGAKKPPVEQAGHAPLRLEWVFWGPAAGKLPPMARRPDPSLPPCPVHPGSTVRREGA